MPGFIIPVGNENRRKIALILATYYLGKGDKLGMISYGFSKAKRQRIEAL